MTGNIGSSLRRKEDPRLLTGQGRYVDDIRVPGLLHAAIVRRPHALREALVHDDAGQLLTGTLMEYGLPTAADVPALEVRALDHPSAVNALGIKGVGESGTIAPSAAIANAVEDALGEGCGDITRLPLTPARVWEAIRAAARAAA